MWLLLIASMLLSLVLAFILHPVSTTIGMLKVLAFCVAGVGWLGLGLGANPELYGAPAILGTACWIGLFFIPTRRTA